MEITSTVNTFSRTKGNELAKGYFPTFPADVDMVKKAINISFGWDTRGVEEKRVCIFDPCAGEGLFLGSMVRHARKAAKESQVKNPVVVSYAVELDSARYEKIRGVDQKICASFFDTTSFGSFDIVLLNPPYNRISGELVQWVDKAAPLVSYHGIMILIIPQYELKGEMLEILRGNFSFCYAYKSEEHAAFKQVVIFLTRQRSNKQNPYKSRYERFYDNLEDTGDDPIRTFRENPLSVEVKFRPVELRPLLQSKDLSGVYLECEERLDKAAKSVLDREYPSSYDTSIQPVSTLRTAHAVQLAAMNSQIESVTINGEHFLAKYMVTTKGENYDTYDDEMGIKTETIVYKPTIETFLMDGKGVVKSAKDRGFDYLELNSQLSTILLRKLNRMYKPLHEIGQDQEYLADELKDIGLKAPQREAVKAVMKAYSSGRKGIGIRANTGTGNTWLAKAIKYLTGAKRSIMVTEPQLIPQMVQEYENEGFDVHVIDSWERLRELAATRPRGLYLLSYTRLRMHPDFVPVTITRQVRTKEGIKYAAVCTACFSEIDRVKRGDKAHCPFCGEPVYTYVPENKRPRVRFRTWIADIERNGTSVEAKSQNKQLPYIRYLKRIPFDLAIFDEAHNAANLMSNQGTAFIRLAATAKRVLAMTATVTNGMAKSLYNLLWGINPQQMKAAGWDRKSTTDFQAQFGAFKEVRKTDEKNRHRDSERVQTYDTAGISPAALIYTLPNFVNVDSEDFDDLPPVEREVIKCTPHPEVEDCMRTIEKIIKDADLSKEDRLAAESVITAAFLRVSDTFRHADDVISLRGCKLGILYRKEVDELLEKEEELIEIVKQIQEWGERLLVYVGNTQKIDLRGPLKGILYRNVPGITVEILPDSVSPNKLVKWFEEATAQVLIVSFHRVATGLNLSQFNNLVWYSYTDNTRRAEQGEGRIRRVNTSDIHRKLFGEVRPVRYWYLTSSPIQEAQLSYTLEKRMIAKLAEGETPDIDPSECASGNQSFSAMITKALKEGSIDYQDPSVLLKKLTKAENARIRQSDPVTQPPKPAPSSAAPISSKVYQIIVMKDRKEEMVNISESRFDELLSQGLLELTLFGAYYREPKAGRKKAA